MERIGYFALTLVIPGHDQPGAEQSRHTVHLGWMEGAPYLVDLGGAGTVLVNGTPIAPNKPVVIEPGDSITLGKAHLTWHAGAGVEAGKPTRMLDRPQFQKVTVVLPEEAPEAPEVGVLADSSAPIKASEEPPRTPSKDETLLVPKRTPPASPEDQALDETLVPTRGTPRPPAPLETGSRSLGRDDAVPAHATDDTLLVPKQPPALPSKDGAVAEALAGPETPSQPEASPQGHDGRAAAEAERTLQAPKQVARPVVPDPTLIVPKAADAPPELPPELAEKAGDEYTYETVWVDMAQLAKQDAGTELEATTILRDTQTPHLVIHLAGRTWPVPLSGERLTIGRTEDNDIPVEDSSLSRHHAAIEPQGDGYTIRDTRSTNGVWLGRQRIDQHRLDTGDVLSLGRAKLIFKGGFTSDDLTLIRPPQAEGRPPRRPVVFVPGLMGSELWIGSEQIWPNIKYLVSNPEIFRLPSDPRIEARNIVSDVVIVPNLVKLRQYSGLGDYLVAGLGYERGTDLLEFAYDWRQDIRLAAQSLAEAIERWQKDVPVTIIAHSLGTLVTRYYVERLGGKRSVERILLMGGPHYGTPGGLAALLAGPGMLPMGMGDERLRSVLSTFPSAYQILPTYPSVTDQHGQTIDLLNDESWLPEPQRPLLRAARSFRRELGERSSVPTVSIFGYGMKTKLRATIHRRPDGLWQQVEFSEDTAGDSSVPSGSAVLRDSEIHPVFQDHGSLYIDDDVRMRLKVELTRSTTWRRR